MTKPADIPSAQLADQTEKLGLALHVLARGLEKLAADIRKALR
jgi:hypothetical protein